MKKIKYILFLLLLFPMSVFASSGDKIYKIDVEIRLDQFGNAHVQEVWDAYANSGSEFYKAEENLGNMIITNFNVKEGNKNYTYIESWDINKGLKYKAYKNGINYTDDGIELCWGKSSYGRHKYIISYDINNFIFNVEDAQVLYFKVINEMELMPKDFTVKVYSEDPFLDTLDVWGYGYKGYAYVSDGIIWMSNEEETYLSYGDYAVLLVKFPKEYFNINSSNTYSYFENFDSVIEMAEEGSYDYDYDSDYESDFDLSELVAICTTVFMVIVLPIISVIASANNNKLNYQFKFGKAGRKIKKEEKITYYRDIPSNKDTIRAYTLLDIYHIKKDDKNLIGSILLKWLLEKKISLNKEITKNLVKEKEKTTIIFNSDIIQTENEAEISLYKMMYEASKDGVLKQKEFEKWSKTHYNSLFNWFKKSEKKEIEKLTKEGYLNKKSTTKYMVNDSLKEEIIKLDGLKNFLIEFGNIREKTAMEVVLWKEYLIFAQLFGVADKVAKEFKNLYPEISVQMPDDFDLMDLYILQRFTYSAMNSATIARNEARARSAAASYSSGGGGFSSGGGGGGSFGGGGGGGR